MKFINDLINNAPFSDTPVGHIINIVIMCFLGLCIIVMAVCIIALLYLLIVSMRRNSNVFKIRSYILDRNLKLYHCLPSYDTMMRGWYKLGRKNTGLNML
jgi:hypothetical protein